LQTACVVTK